MKRMLVKLFSLCAVLTLVSSTGYTMGDGGSDDAPKIPKFQKLNRGEPSYVGTIVEKNKKTRANQISFTGSTKIDGLRSEDSDAVTQLDLGDVLTIEVKKSAYSSEKFTQEYVLVTVVSKKKNKTGEHIKRDLLVPRNVQFSAQDLESKFELAWWLRDIKKIKIDHPQPLQQAAPAA